MGAVADFVHLVFLSVLQVVVHLIQLILSPFIFAHDRLRARPRRDFKSLLITGASSGLGAELAESYAKPGVHVAITGRNDTRLREIEARCKAKGASVTVGVIDVTDQAKLIAFIEDVDGQHPLDLVIANAGITGFTESKDDSYTVLQSTVNVTNTNVLGVANTVFPAIAKMCQRKYGQVVVMGSLSGNFPMLASPEYAAGKAYLKSLCRALRPYLALYNVGLTVLAPGFVRTPLLASPKKYPYEIDSKTATALMVDAINRDVGYFPFPTVPAIMTTVLGSVHAAFFEILGPLLLTKIHPVVKARLTLSEAESANLKNKKK